MIAEYDETGRIFHTISDPLPEGLIEAYAELGKTFAIAEGPISFQEHYVKDGEVTVRPDHKSQVVVSGLSILLHETDDCIVNLKVDGLVMRVTSDRLDFDEAGKSTLTVTPPWPYKEKVFEIENK